MCTYILGWEWDRKSAAREEELLQLAFSLHGLRYAYAWFLLPLEFGRSIGDTFFLPLRVYSCTFQASTKESSQGFQFGLPHWFSSWSAPLKEEEDVCYVGQGTSNFWV